MKQKDIKFEDIEHVQRKGKRPFLEDQLNNKMNNFSDLDTFLS